VLGYLNIVASRLGYQPNPLARALRAGQTIASSEFDSRSMSGALVIMDASNFMLAMNAIQQAGLRVPDDVSVVEFDGTQAAMGYSALSLFSFLFFRQPDLGCFKLFRHSGLFFLVHFRGDGLVPLFDGALPVRSGELETPCLLVKIA
jgi:hypothetical protein